MLTPQDHDSAQPSGWSNLAHEEIAGNLEEDVGNEKDHEGDVEVLTLHMEVLLKTLNTRIADVNAIQEGERVEKCDDGYDAKVELAK